MPITYPKLWSVSITSPVSEIDFYTDALENLDGEEPALSLSVMNAPRTPIATAEAIFDARPNQAELMARLAVIAALRQLKSPKLIIREVPNLDWLHKVATDFPPLPIARWIIHGAAHKDAAMTHITKKRLQIDATSAFGTGEHPTTRGCLIMLDRLLKRGLLPRHLLDMGCGTGILALAFVKAKPGQAVAVDLDADSIIIARDNARANGAQRKLHLGLSRGYRCLARRYAPFDLIMANIFAKPLAHMAKDLKRHLRPGGYAILAGLLNSQANLVLAAHRSQGLYLEERLVIGEWTILCLRRPCRASLGKAE